MNRKEEVQENVVWIPEKLQHTKVDEETLWEWVAEYFPEFVYDLQCYASIRPSGWALDEIYSLAEDPMIYPKIPIYKYQLKDCTENAEKHKGRRERNILYY